MPTFMFKGDLADGPAVLLELPCPISIDGNTRAADAGTATLRGGKPGLRPLDQDLPLKLREGRDEVDEELPLRRRPVERLGDRDETDSDRVEIGERFHHVAERSKETIASPHHEDVELPLLRVGKKSVQLGPLLTRTRDAVVEVEVSKRSSVSRLNVGCPVDSGVQMLTEVPTCRQFTDQVVDPMNVWRR